MAEIEINQAEGSAIDVGETVLNKEESIGDYDRTDSNTPKISTEHLSEEAMSNAMQKVTKVDGNEEFSVAETVIQNLELMVDKVESAPDKNEKMSEDEDLEVLQLKEAMVEKIKSLVDEDIFIDIIDLINIMATRAEENFQEHADKVSDRKKYFEEYKAIILRESQKIGETLQLKLLEKSSPATEGLSVVPEDLHEASIEEFSKLSEAFKKTINLESLKLLEETYGIKIPEALIDKKELNTDYDTTDRGIIRINVEPDSVVTLPNAMQKNSESEGEIIWTESEQPVVKDPGFNEDENDSSLDEPGKASSLVESEVMQLKESIGSMVEAFKTLVGKETLIAIEGLIEMISTRAEENFQEHADKVSDQKKYFEEYKAIILRESLKIGETLQLKLLEKSSRATEGLSVIPVDLHGTAIEELSKLSEEFKKTIDLESLKLLEETYGIKIPKALMVKKELKESIGSMVETFKSLVDEETLTVIKGLIDMIASRAEKILQENADKITDWRKFYEEYKKVMLRESQKLGELFQWRLLEKSCEATKDLSAIPENFHEIAIEEFSKLSGEFSETINRESMKLLEGQCGTNMSTEMASLLYSEVGRRTLAIIKPDAYEYADEMLYKIKKFGFTVVQERRVTLTPEQASLFYGEHLAKAFSLRLIEHMSSGPMVALCLASAHCPNTITAWREVMGPTDVSEAVAIFPNTLRAEYGDPNNQVRNALHGSHSLEDAEREIHFFFPDIILDPLPKVIDISSVLDEMSQGVLHKALVAICKEKPPNTLSWFAHWLKHNIPNSPSISTDWNPTTHPML